VTTLIIGCGYLGERAGILISRGGESVHGTVRSQHRATEIGRRGITPVVADVLEPDSLRRLPAAGCVLYCVGFDRSAGASMRSVYVDGLKNVLDRLPPVGLRFVYASSTGVYGQTGGEWVDEQTPPRPRQESGKLCLEAEEHVRAWAGAGNRSTSAIILRFAGLYGPGRVVRRAMLERGEPIPGDPERYLNLIQIDDAAHVAVAALASGAPNPIYLVADDRPVTRREYYARVAALLGAPEPRYERPDPETIEASRDETNKRIANGRMKRGLDITLAYPDITTGLRASLELRAGESSERG
jgi:nucleoside-diphosphate-sugar epimerase